MASLLETQRTFRARLLVSDRLIARGLVRIYAELSRAIDAELRGLTEAIRLARLAGEEVNQSWLFQEQRYRSLLQQADSAYRQAAAISTGNVAGAQDAAIHLGQEAAEALTRSLAPPQIAFSWSRLPTGAIGAFVGAASDGSPLSQLFDSLGPQGSANIRSALIRGIGLGYSPRKIAALVQDQVGISLTRALAISRTEVIRAYRQSSSDGYRANSDVVQAKIWHAQLDDRVCPVCAAMHGTVLTLDEEIESHVNCRCSAIPVTKTWAELGYDGIADTNPDIEAGPDWFARQPSERQAAILGPGRHAAYQQGLSLPDMVGRKVDRRWGPVRYTLPLGEALRRAGRKAA